MTIVEKTGHPSEFSGYLRVVTRFPVTLACAALFVALFAGGTLGLFNDISFFQENTDTWLDVVLLLFLLIPASLAATLFAEARAWPTHRRFLLIGLTVVLCAPMAAASGQYSIINVFYLGAGGIWILAILSPSLRPGLSNQAFWSVTRKVLSGAASGLLATLVIAFGAMIGFELIDELFRVRAPSDLESNIWFFSVTMIWPFFTLLHMPEVSGAPEAVDAPGWLVFAFNRLLAPLALITAVLFLAFAAMTAIQWEFPSHWPILTVIAVAGIGLLLWLAFFPFRDQGSRALRLYQRTFPFALLALAAMPAAVAADQIAAAGVILLSYWELLLSVTIGGIAVYLLAARLPRLIVPPLAIALVLIGGSFGPWGALALSRGSQIGQFEALLEETGHLVDGRIVPEGGKVDPATSRRLDSMIWSIRRNWGSDSLSDWLAGAGITIDGETETIEVLDRMGIRYVAKWEEEGSFTFELEEGYLYSGRLLEPVDVAGYDVYTPLSVGGTERVNEVSSAATNQTYIVTVADLTLHIARMEDSANGVTLDIRRIVEPLLETQTDETTVAPADRMTVEAQNNGLRVRLIVEQLEGTAIDGVIQASGGQGLLLIGRAE